MLSLVEDIHFIKKDNIKILITKVSNGRCLITSNKGEKNRRLTHIETKFNNQIKSFPEKMEFDDEIPFNIGDKFEFLFNIYHTIEELVITPFGYIFITSWTDENEENYYSFLIFKNGLIKELKNEKEFKWLDFIELLSEELEVDKYLY